MDSGADDVFRIKIEQKLQSLHARKYPVKIVGAKASADSDLKRMEEGQMRRLTQPQLVDIINEVMVFQHHAIELGDHINQRTRLQLCLILFQAALVIVINTYDLATFLINSALEMDRRWLSIAMAFFFYGYHILFSGVQVLLTVFAFTMVYNAILNTASLVMQLDLYASDVSLRARLMEFAVFVNTNLRKYSIYGLFNLDGSLIATLMSGTVTYIILLIQYGDNDQLLGGKSQPSHLSSNHTL